MILFSYEKLYDAIIKNRPSKKIKSPFVADALIENKEFLVHTPSLGCCGLCQTDSKVKCIKINSEKCSYRACLSEIETKGKKILIGIEPKSAEKIALEALNKNLVKDLRVSKIEKEKKFLNSRFDFCGITSTNQKFICEVKNVPIADYADVTKTERKKMDFSKRKYNDKIAYFPDGYRKNSKSVISERALKHVNELEIIKNQNPEIRCILLFVIQREDVSSFQPSRLDPIYLEAIRKAFNSGVEIKTIQVKWEKNNAIFLRNDLPINIFD